MNEADGLYQMFGQLGDVILLKGWVTELLTWAADGDENNNYDNWYLNFTFLYIGGSDEAPKEPKIAQFQDVFRMEKT